MRVGRLISGLVVGLLVFSGLLVSGITVAPAQAALTPTWQAETDMPAPRAQAQTVIGDDGKIYVFGGVRGIYSASHEYMQTVNDASVYDPATGVWSSLAPMQYGARSGVAMAGDDGLFYVFGGYNDTWSTLSYAQIYDPEGDSWSLGTSMPVAESFLAGAKGFDGRMYVIGGTDGLGRVQIYDPTGDSWSVGTNMPSPRFAGTCVAIDDGYQIYYLGGTSSFGSSSTVCMVYYPDGNSWGYLPDMPVATAAGTAAAAYDGLVYFMGGSNTAYNTGGLLAGQLFYSTTYCYSRFNSTWFEVEGLPYETKYAMSVASEDGRVWFIGGNNNTVVYDSVSTLEVMRITVSLSSSATVQGGNVLVYVDPQFAYLDVNYYYFGAHLVTPTGFALEGTEMSTQEDTAFAVEMIVPVAAEPGVYTVTMDYFGLYTPNWYNVDLPLQDFLLTVDPVVPIEDLIAALEAQVADLQAALDAQTADIATLQAQLTALQAQLAGLQAGLLAMGASQAAAMAALNLTLADLQSQLDDFQEQIDRVESKADTGGTMSLVTVVLVIVVIVLLALMFMMARKKP